jgi:hypothetical protein
VFLLPVVFEVFASLEVEFVELEVLAFLEVLFDAFLKLFSIINSPPKNLVLDYIVIMDFFG